MSVSYTAFGYGNKREKNNDVNLGYITIGKTELCALTGCRRVAYAISVHTSGGIASLNGRSSITC